MSKYFSNLSETMIQANRVALHYRDPKAWENKKTKTFKMHRPRGKAYLRMADLMRKSAWKKIQSELDPIIDKAKAKGIIS